MKKSVLSVLSAALITAVTVTLSPAAATAAQPPTDTSERALIAAAERHGPQRVIVQLKDKGDQDRVLGSLRSTQAQVTTKRKYERLPLLALEADSNALKQLVASDRVVSIQPDVAVPPSLASTIPLINADDVHGFGFIGTGFNVAILDTGIDRDHPFFNGRIAEEACFSSSGSGQQTLCPDGSNDQTGAGAADAETANCLDGGSNICSHGSHVAGIAAGAAAGVTGAPGNGVAPGAGIIAIQVFTRFNNDSDCDGNAPCVLSFTSDQIAGLEHVLDLTDDHAIASANMSLGDTGNNTSNCDGDSRKTAIDALLAEDIATVISAGNEGHPAGVGAPGCISTAVTVGATEDDDDVAGFSNRGTLLDLFAPGVSVVSSVPDDTWANFQGTSMAAPHVTGAFAVLRQARPGETTGQLLNRLRDTGVDVTYPSGGSDVTTPRIDLLGTVPIPPPTADAGGPYSTVEGTSIGLSGSGTNATSFLWDLDNDGAFDDAAGQTPVFGLVGQDGVFTVGLQVTGPGGTATDTATVTVANVAPQVVANVNGPAPEGGTIIVQGTVVDPGWLDPLTATINWGDGTSQPASGVLENNPPNATLTFSANHVYGDNGTFTITVCGFDDDTSTCGSTPVTITNVNPNAVIDESGAVDTPAGKTIVTEEGDDLGLSGRVTDPGSDDLIITWDFGDGGASPDQTTTSLVNPPNPDPALSPSVQPRDVTNTASVEYKKACVYQVGFAARDDDGGTGSDQVAVVVQDNGHLAKISTLWYLEFLLTTLPPDHFPDDVLKCYLDISAHMSGVFGEVTDASSISKARNVLGPRLLPTAQQQFDREALAAWLNFAHGAFDVNSPIDTDCNLHADSTFLTVIRNAEAVRLNPASSASAIRAQANLLARVNLCNPL